MIPPLRIEKLRREHEVEGFDCGREELNRYLARFALTNQQAGAAQTYLAISGEAVAGFYTLAVGEVAHAEAPGRLTKGLARHPVPIMLLARLAVGRDWQGKGLGAGLLKDAMRRTLQAAEIAGIRAFAVHAKDEPARAFYEHFGFVASPTDPRHLFLLIKDIRNVAGGQTGDGKPGRPHGAGLHGGRQRHPRVPWPGVRPVKAHAGMKSGAGNCPSRSPRRK